MFSLNFTTKQAQLFMHPQNRMLGRKRISVAYVIAAAVIILVSFMQHVCRYSESLPIHQNAQYQFLWNTNLQFEDVTLLAFNI